MGAGLTSIRSSITENAATAITFFVDSGLVPHLFPQHRLLRSSAAVVNSPPTDSRVVGCASAVGKFFSCRPRVQEDWEWASRFWC